MTTALTDAPTTAPTLADPPHWTGPSTQILGALKRMSPARAGRPAVPILAGVVLDVTPTGGLTIHAWNYETAVSTRVHTDDDTLHTPGRCVVHARDLERLIRAVTTATGEKNPTITLDGASRPGWLQVSASGYSVSLRTMPLEEYPDSPTFAPTLGDPLGAKVLGVDFASALAFTTIAADATDCAPAILAAVSINVIPGAFTLYATDRYRLTTATAPATLHPTWMAADPLLIPRQVASALVRYLGPGEWSITHILPTGNGTALLHVTDGETVIVTSLIDGTYPKVSTLLDQAKGSPRVITVDRLKLAAAARFANAITDRRAYARMTVGVNGVTCTLANDDPDEPTTTAPPAPATRIEAWTEPDEAVIGFNPEFLLAALAGFTGPTVALRFAAGVAEIRPMLMASTVADLDDPRARRHLLMPVRLAK